jgi:hypothetical protein
MPILFYVPVDPTDLVLQGEQFRVSVMENLVDPSRLLMGGVPAPTGFSSVLQDEDAFSPMNSFIDQSILSIRRQKNGSLQVRANAGVATPCGEWVPIDYSPLIKPYIGATELWQIVGTTRDSAGAILGDCAVMALETGRMTVEGTPVVGMTKSDGSGNYTIQTAGNSAHQVIAYKDGPVAGISLNTLTPTQVP